MPIWYTLITDNSSGKPLHSHTVKPHYSILNIKKWKSHWTHSKKRGGFWDSKNCLLEKSCYIPHAPTKPNIQAFLFSFPEVKNGLRSIKQLHFGAAVIPLLFHYAVYVLCLVNAGTNCCTNHLRWTTDISKLPPLQSPSYRISPSLSSTSYKHRNLPLH